MKRSRFNTPKFWLKIIFLIASALLLIVFFQHLSIQVRVSTFVQSTLLWVKMLGAIGAIAFIVIYNVATVLFIPASLLTLGGGAIYGLVWGSVYVFVAATLGATFAFLIGRYFARNWVSEKINKNVTFRAIDEAVAIDGFKIVLLTRLSPIFPFNMLNYVFGVTRVALKDYVLGSIGMIPATIMYVYLGSLLGDIALLEMQPANIISNPQAQIVRWGIKVLGLVATLAVTIQVSRLANKILVSKL